MKSEWVTRAIFVLGTLCSLGELPLGVIATNDTSKDRFLVELALLLSAVSVICLLIVARNSRRLRVPSYLLAGFSLLTVLPYLSREIMVLILSATKH